MEQYKEKPLISIIIPIYKAEKHIERCIRSILNQTLKNFELILVIDGSPDNSLAICQKIAKEDERIHVLNQENGGAHSARKAGFKVAIAPYICFVDADDTMPSTAVKILYSEIIKGYDIVKGADALHKRQHKACGQTELDSKHFVEGMYVNDIDPFLWGTLYKRTLFDEYIFDICIKNHLVIGEDWISNLYIGKCINKALIIDIPVYNYFTNEGSVMNTFTMSDEYGLRIDKIIRMIIGEDPQWDYMKLLKKAICVGTFFCPFRSFSPDVYRAFKTFVATYGMSPLYQYVDKRFLWFSRYEVLYRIYSWCYKTAKALLYKKKLIID